MNKQTIIENKAVVVTILFVFFIIIILPLVLTFLIRIIPGGIQPSLVNTKKIYGQLDYHQEFISPENNLGGIGVSIKNPNFANKKAVLFNLYKGQEIIRKVILNGQNIADGKFVKILFDPIKDSKDQGFTWSISSPDSTFEDATEIFLTDRKPTWSRDLKINNEISEQGFSYVTLHRAVSPTEVLVRVIKEWIYKVQADRLFLVGWTILIIVLLGAIFAKFPPRNLKRPS